MVKVTEPRSNWTCRYCHEETLYKKYYLGTLKCLASDDGPGLQQLVWEMDSYEFSYVWRILHTKQKAKFKELQTKQAGFTMEETGVDTSKKKA